MDLNDVDMTKLVEHLSPHEQIALLEHLKKLSHFLDLSKEERQALLQNNSSDLPQDSASDSHESYDEHTP